MAKARVFSDRWGCWVDDKEVHFRLLAGCASLMEGCSKQTVIVRLHVE